MVSTMKREVLITNIDAFCCDYESKTVSESIEKYNIPDDWCAEFDAYDDVYPTLVIQVDRIRKIPAVMNMKIRNVKNPDDEYAGCTVFQDRQTVAFKIDYLKDLLEAINTQSGHPRMGVPTKNIDIR